MKIFEKYEVVGRRSSKDGSNAVKHVSHQAADGTLLASNLAKMTDKICTTKRSQPRSQIIEDHTLSTLN